MAHCGRQILDMQLFHELKQRFPDVPDHVVTRCIRQTRGSKDECTCILEAENWVRGGSSAGRKRCRHVVSKDIVEKLTEMIAASPNGELINQDLVVFESESVSSLPGNLVSTEPVSSSEVRLGSSSMDEEDVFLSARLCGGKDLSLKENLPSSVNVDPTFHSSSSNSVAESLISLKERPLKPEIKPRPAKIPNSLSLRTHQQIFPNKSLSPTTDASMTPGKLKKQEDFSEALLEQPLIIVSPSTDEGIDSDGASFSTENSSAQSTSKRSSLNSLISPNHEAFKLGNVDVNCSDNSQSNVAQSSKNIVCQTSSSSSHPFNEAETSVGRDSRVLPISVRKISAPVVPHRSKETANSSFQKQFSHEGVFPEENKYRPTVPNTVGTKWKERTSEGVHHQLRSPGSPDSKIPPKVPQRPHQKPNSFYDVNSQDDIEEAFQSRTDISFFPGRKDSHLKENTKDERNELGLERLHPSLKSQSSEVHDQSGQAQVPQPLQPSPQERKDSSSRNTPKLRKQESRRKSHGSPVSPTPPTPLHTPSNIQELLERQLAARDRLESELNKDLLRLQSLKTSVEILEAELISLKELKNEVIRLRILCKKMTAEVDFINATSDIPVPLGETNEDFYKNIYAGPNFRKQKHKSSKHRSRKPAANPGSAVQIEPDLNQPWECSMCTFMNHPQLNSCEQCEMHRLMRSNRGQGTESANVQIHVVHQNYPSCKVVHSWVL